MKRLYSLFLCFVLLVGSFSHLAGCAPIEEVPRFESADPRISYKEQLDEDALEFYDALALERAEASQNKVTGFRHTVDGTLKIDPSVYYLKATIDEEQTRKNIENESAHPVVLTESPILCIPVFLENGNATRIRGEIVGIQSAILYGAQENYDRGYYYRIYEKASSVSFLEELCIEEDLGELQSTTIIILDLRGSKTEDCILLETEKGSYIYDPMHIMEELTFSSNVPDAYLYENGSVYEASEFFTAYFGFHKEVKKRNRQSNMRLLKSLFEEVIEEVFS